MSLKKYMWIDLAVLTVIGFSMEILGLFIINKAITALIVTSVISLLIMFVAVFRWGWKGLIIAPVVALGTIIGGRFVNPVEQFRANYDWRLYIATVCQLLTVSVNIFWFKKIKNEKETAKNLYCLFSLCAINCIISVLVLSFVYWCTAQVFRLDGFLAWDAMAFVILFVGAFVLSKQGTLTNVKKKLIEEKEEIEFENNFRMNLTDDVIESLGQEEGDSRDGKDS